MRGAEGMGEVLASPLQHIYSVPHTKCQEAQS